MCIAGEIGARPPRVSTGMTSFGRIDEAPDAEVRGVRRTIQRRKRFIRLQAEPFAGEVRLKVRDLRAAQPGWLW
jgi:hypothetical protein